MGRAIDVSAIIPTFNRCELVVRAVDSALGQTRRIDEIIVVDDGSTDDTRAVLHARYGDRIRYVWQPNAGVSAARNRGMSMAQGRYFALLDSDDEWLPEKNALQFDWLEQHPDFGMVLCDVLRVDSEHNEIDVQRRRDVIREDGWALHWVMHDPSLVPASAMIRREVFEDIGGFDETLRTAEDLEYHLRIVRRWRVGVVETPLVRALRGHDGLSSLSSTYDDYLDVVEKALDDIEGLVDETERRRALVNTYVRNARGMLICGRWGEGRRLASKAWRIAPDATSRKKILGLAKFGLRRAIRTAIRRQS